MNNQILCDTCILIDFANGRSRQLADLHSQNIQLFINPVIELELLQGARNKAEMQKLEKILAYVPSSRNALGSFQRGAATDKAILTFAWFTFS
jgi:predicted nucleic acid-binding protein